MIENANMITTIMYNCLDQYIALCIENQSKHHNFAFSWFRDNIPCFAALITLNQHAIEDVTYVDIITNILRNQFRKDYNFIEVTESTGDVEG